MYLFGELFTVFTDHKPITEIKDRLKSASERIRRWFLQLYDYTFVIIYKEGKINFDADFLSRIDYVKDEQKENRENDIIAFTITQEKIDLVSLQSNDLFCFMKIKQLLEYKDKNLHDFGEKFIVLDSVLYHLSTENLVLTKQAVLPILGRNKVINECHNAGHFGKWKTFKLISLSYWWPEMHEDVAYFVRRCNQCAKKKQRFGPSRGKLIPMAPQIPLPVYGVFSLIGFDIVLFDEALLKKEKLDTLWLQSTIFQDSLLQKQSETKSLLQ